MPKIISTSKQCAECDRTFRPSRADQRYCSKTCKRAVERKQKAATKKTADAVKSEAATNGNVSLRDVRLNPSLNPLLAAWNQLDDCAKRIIEHAEKHLGPEALARAALGQEKINDGFLLLDEVAESIR